jgi:hypothetical protein
VSQTLTWACGCGWVAWGNAQQYDHWKMIHKCKGDDVPTIQEKIEAAKKRLEADKAKIAELEAKAAEAPKRQKDRSVIQIREIMLLETQVRKTYGVGYSGLAEIVRKAKKDGVTLPEVTGMQREEEPAYEDRELPPAPPPVEPTPNATDEPFGDVPREHHGDGDEPLPVEEGVTAGGELEAPDDDLPWD